METLGSWAFLLFLLPAIAYYLWLEKICPTWARKTLVKTHRKEKPLEERITTLICKVVTLIRKITAWIGKRISNQIPPPETKVPSSYYPTGSSSNGTIPRIPPPNPPMARSDLPVAAAGDPSPSRITTPSNLTIHSAFRTTCERKATSSWPGAPKNPSASSTPQIDPQGKGTSSRTTPGTISPASSNLPIARSETVSEIARGVAIYVDWENISWLRAQHLNSLIPELDRIYGKATSVKVFTSKGRMSRCVEAEMTEAGYRLIKVPVEPQGVDKRIVKEAIRDMRQLPKTVAILTSDSDFARIVQQIAENNRVPIILANSYNLSGTLWKAVQKANGKFYKMICSGFTLKLEEVASWQEPMPPRKCKVVRTYAENPTEQKKAQVTKTSPKPVHTQESASADNQRREEPRKKQSGRSSKPRTYSESSGITMIIRSVPNRFYPESYKSVAATAAK